MQLRNCTRCGKLFAYVNRPVCPACAKLEEEEFEQVKQYLRQHPYATVLEVAEATGIDQHRIQEWVRQGRLISTEFRLLGECESCGAPIASGRFCRNCAARLEAELKGQKVPLAYEKEKGREELDIKQTGKVHIKDQLEQK